jgi:hypothetical protein
MALIDTIVIFVVSAVIGGAGIFLGVRLIADDTASFGSAVVTALLGAIGWAIVSFFVGFIPVLGALLALIIWIAVINFRYPGGWGTAAGIGFVAWLVSSLILYLLGTLGIISLSALGVPGI